MEEGFTRCFLMCLFYLAFYSTRTCDGIPTSREHPSISHQNNTEDFHEAFNKDADLNLETAKEVDLILDIAKNVDLNLDTTKDVDLNLDTVREVDLNLDTTKDAGVILDTINRVDFNLDTTKGVDLNLNRPQVVDLNLQTVKEVDLNLNTAKDGHRQKVDKAEDFPPSLGKPITSLPSKETMSPSSSPNPSASEDKVLNSKARTLATNGGTSSSQRANEETTIDQETIDELIREMKYLSRRMEEQDSRIQHLSDINEKLVEDLNASKAELLKADEAREQHQILEENVSELRSELEAVSLAGEEHRLNCDEQFEQVIKDMNNAEQITEEKMEAVEDSLKHADHKNKEAFDRLSSQLERADDARQHNSYRIVDLQKAVKELESGRGRNQENVNYLEEDVKKVTGPTALGLKSVFIESDEFDGRRYYLFDGFQARNIHEAQRKCGSVNGYLAEINNRSEFDFVQKFVRHHLPGPRYTAVYIGGSDEETEGMWMFPRTGKTMMYTNWKTHVTKDQPNGGRGSNCVALLGGVYNWLMVDEPCNNWKRTYWFRDGSQRFVCEMEP